jgi:hypothetical protein
MNFDFYIFGTPDGYQQYPTDSHRSRFKEFEQNKQANAQLNIYRKGQLMYYAYTRELDNPNKYIGICLVYNGVCCLDIRRLFDFFDNYIIQSLIKGKVLQQDKQEKYLFATDNFRNNVVELDNLDVEIKQYIDSHFGLDFVAIDDTSNVRPFAKYMSLHDGNNDIIAVMHKYQYVIVTKRPLDPSKIKKIRTNKKNLRIIIAIIVLLLGVCVFGGVKRYQSYKEKQIVYVENSEVVLQDGTTYTYTGQMQYKLPNGNGKAVYQNKDVYEGAFNKGLKDGKGKMTFSDGYIYTGDYLHDKAEGQGEMNYPNGKIYNGGWKNNAQHGKGVVHEKGKLISGEWENGVKIK